MRGALITRNGLWLLRSSPRWTACGGRGWAGGGGRCQARRPRAARVRPRQEPLRRAGPEPRTANGAQGHQGRFGWDAGRLGRATGVRLPTVGVSCFRAAACRSQAGRLRIDRLNGRDAHHHYLGLYLPRTRFARPKYPRPRVPLLAFRAVLFSPPPRKAASTHSPAPGSGVGLWLKCEAGAGSVQTSCPQPPAVLRFQTPGFVLSETVAEAAALAPLLQKPSWEMGKNHPGPCSGAPPRPTPPQGRNQERPLRRLTRAGVTAGRSPRRRRRPAEPGETPKGSLNTIYKYYGLSARASRNDRPPIGCRNLSYLHSRIAQLGGDWANARPRLSGRGPRGRDRVRSRCKWGTV